MTAEDFKRLANGVAPLVTLQRIYLYKMNCRREVSYPVPERIQISIDLRTSLMKSQIEQVVPFACSMTVTGTDQEKKAEYFTIVPTLCLIYDLNPSESQRKLEKLALEAFSLTQGVIDAWPYLRKHVLDVLIQMELPGILIPPLSIDQLAEIAAARYSKDTK